jgi:replication factor A1
MKIEDIIQCILSQTQDVAREEILKAIAKKRTASGELLTSEAAARLVAAELGVDIKLAKKLPKIHINQLVSGLNNVTVSGRVLLATTPKAFLHQDRHGQIARLLIADKTGTIKVVLWNDKAKFAKKIQLRHIVKILHGYVRKSRTGELELHVGQQGTIQTTPSDAKECDFPSINNFLEKIHNIRQDHRKTNVKGVIQTIYPMTSFQRHNGTQGKVIRMELKDETGHIPVVFWNERAEDMALAKEGMLLLLMNAKVKKSQNESLELHVDNFANVELMNHVENLLRIADLKEGMRVPFIEGTVATKSMFREVTTRKGEKIPVVSFELKDDTGKVWVSAWRKHAEKAESLPVDAKVGLKDVYVRRGFGDQLEITTRSSTKIEVKQ